MYTTLSRVRQIESLYLIQKLHHANFKVSEKVKNELQRLQTTMQWTLQYNLPTILPSQHIICSLNTHSLLLHEQDITHDHALFDATIL